MTGPYLTDGAPQSFMRLLSNLRWLAVAGQLLTVLIVTGPMNVALSAPPLWAGIAVLAAFNVFASWRARVAASTSARETFLHLLVDIAVLAWLVAWSGGIENPFSSLFLLPIALAILVLPTGWVWITTAAVAIGYGLSAWLGRELPHVHGAMGDTFSVHKIGMLVNFIVTAAVLLGFYARMVRAWRARERELAELREQFARNEGIVALATHAASVAHELNTPLGTLMLMVDDLAGGPVAPPSREDIATMKTLLESCRDRVRELASSADARGAGGRPRSVNLERVIDRWQLVRPTIELRRSGSIAGHEEVDAGVGHLLQALLNNAADASEAAGARVVDLHLASADGSLTGEIRDHGAGFGEAEPLLPGTLFRTSKPDGLGLGLALSHATVERLGGALSMEAAPEGRGVQVRFRLPLAVAR